MTLMRFFNACLFALGCFLWSGGPASAKIPRKPVYVTAAAVSPDFKSLAVAYNRDRPAEVWDIAAGEKARDLPIRNLSVTTLAWAPDGESLLLTVRDDDGQEADRRFDLTRSDWLPPPPRRDGLPSPDGKWVAVKGPDGVELRPAGGEKAVHTFPWQVAGGFGGTVAFSPDGRHLLVGDRTGLTAWNLTGGRAWHADDAYLEPTGRNISADGKTALVSGPQQVCRLLDLASGKAIRTFAATDGQCFRFAFLPDGKHVLTGEYNQDDNVWEVESGRQVRSLKGSREYGGDYFVSPDGKRVLLAGRLDATLFDLATGEEIHTLFGPPPAGPNIYAVALSADGEYAAAGGYRNTLVVWHVPTGKQVQALRPELNGGGQVVALSPDGRRLLAAGFDNSAELWDVSAGKRVRVLEGHEGHVTRLAFAPKRKEIVTCDDRSIRVWGPTAEEVRLTIKVPKGSSPAAISADGERALVTGDDGDVYSTADGTKIQVKRWLDLDSEEGGLLAWSPNGRYAATRGPSLKLLDAAGGKERAKNLEPRRENAPWTAAAFSPDNKLLLVGDEQGKLRLWDVESGRLVRQFRGKGVTPEISAIVFAADGKHVLTGGPGATVKWWDIETGTQRKAFLLTEN